MIDMQHHLAELKTHFANTLSIVVKLSDPEKVQSIVESVTLESQIKSRLAKMFSVLISIGTRWVSKQDADPVKNDTCLL